MTQIKQSDSKLSKFLSLSTGAMYLRADQLAGVVRLFEVLRMKCGVSVSKMVAVEERTKGGGRTRDAIKCCREIHFSDVIFHNRAILMRFDR